MGQIGEAQFEQCVDALYAALACPSTLPKALTSVVKLFDTTGAGLPGAASYKAGVPPGKFEPFADVRVLMEHCLHAGSTELFSAGSRPELRYGDGCGGFMYVFGPQYTDDVARDAGRRRRCADKDVYGMDEPGELHAKPLGGAALELMDRIKPHLIRVARLLSEQQASGVAYAAPVALAEALSTGVCVVDTDLQVVHANRAALGVLAGAGPLVLRSNVLAGRGPGVQAQLRRAVALATKSPGEAWSFSPNPDDVMPRRLQVRVLPLDAKVSLARVKGGPFALLFIANGTGQLRRDELSQLFGLTPSEADLVRLLGEGLTPAICADRRRVGIATVRTQLKCVFAKTGVNSLPQLMCRVLALPGLL